MVGYPALARSAFTAVHAVLVVALHFHALATVLSSSAVPVFEKTWHVVFKEKLVTGSN